MIIRLSFKDNDYTHIIEKFLDNPIFYKYYCSSLIKNNQTDKVNEYIDLSKEIDEYLSMIQYNIKFTQGQKDRFCNIIREAFIKYLEDYHQSNFKYLAENLEIKTYTNISDKDENDENVYYFMMHNKYITM